MQVEVGLIETGQIRLEFSLEGRGVIFAVKFGRAHAAEIASHILALAQGN